MTPAIGNPFTSIEPASELPLAATDRFAAAGHLWGQSEIDALILAYAASRPLLVRGEAGSGKSQIARAAAAWLGHTSPLVEVIHPRFEALDLLYQVDPVARLADAQINKLDRTNRRYVRKGRLWQAMATANRSASPPVLLIDEIDKADADMPNALLEVLGNRSFPVPPLKGTIVRLEDGRRMPLIVITTNEERELPPAFVRRCVVLNVSPPDPGKDEAGFIAWLVDRGRVHRGLMVADDVRAHAARQVVADRKVVVSAGYPPVGLAEYIDLLTALHDLTHHLDDESRGKVQVDWLQRLSAYALIKNDQDQGRPPVAMSEPATATLGNEGP